MYYDNFKVRPVIPFAKYDLGDVPEPDTKSLTSWQMFVKLFFAEQRKRNSGATMTDCAEAYALMKVQAEDDEVRSAVMAQEEADYSTPEAILMALEEDEEAEVSLRAMVVPTTKLLVVDDLVHDLFEDMSYRAFLQEELLYGLDGFFAPLVPISFRPPVGHSNAYDGLGQTTEPERTRETIRRPLEAVLTQPTTLDELEAEMEQQTMPEPWVEGHYDAHTAKNASRIRKAGKDIDRSSVRGL